MASASSELPPMMAAPGMLANETLCFPSGMVTTNGIWIGENPFFYAFPLFLIQNLVFIITTRLIMFVGKPINITCTVSEILCGMVWSNYSGLGRMQTINYSLMLKRSMPLVDTLANIGVIYFLFTLGLEMDLSLIKKHGKKSLIVALAGICLPFLIACSFSFFLFKLTVVQQAPFILLFGTALSVTSFPVLSRTLSEFRLLGMEIGELARTVALVNELFGITITVVAVSLAESPESPFQTTLWIFLSTAVFVALCILVVGPGMKWLMNRKGEDEGFGDLATSVMIAGVMFSAVITDAIGVHPMFGAFMFGLVVPHGVLSMTLVEQLEDFVTGILLPLLFVLVGVRTCVTTIGGFGSWVMLIFAIVLGSAGKVAGTVLATLSMQMPFSEGVGLGLLMNTKGLIIMLGLNYGKDQKVIDNTTFTIMVMTVLIANTMVTPTLVRVYKPARRFVPYKRRTVQQTRGDSELRILTCIHNPRNVPTIVNLLEASYPTKRSPISAFSLHLVEQMGNGICMVVSHGKRRGAEEGAVAALGRVRAQTEDIVNAFNTFERGYSGAVAVEAMSGVAAYSLMHEQICDLAEEKRVSLVILPFHKQQTVDGSMESTNPKFRDVNENVLGNSPSSVAILVDRGLGGSTRNNIQGSRNIAVLFFGGPDDREALSLGIRMSSHPGNTLNVIRFTPGPEAVDPEIDQNQEREYGILTLQIDKDRDKMLDDDYIKDLKMMKLNDESFSYIEKEVNNGDETIAAIRSVNNIHDLFIVGRSQGAANALTSGLTEWSECPELGVIGDLLASSDFGLNVSVLVVQQYTGMGPTDDATSGTPNSSNNNEERYFMGSMH